MADVVIQQITTIEDAEVARMVDMLVDMAYKKNITSRYVYRDDVELMREWYACQARGAIAGAYQYGAYLPNGQLVGCISGYPPGVEYMADETQTKQGYDELKKKIPAESLKWYAEFMPQFMAMADGAIGKGAKKASWNIHSLVVDPAYRGRGIAKALMAVIEDMAKRDNKPIILDADKSDFTVSMYQHLGYQIIFTKEVERPPGVEAPNLFITTLKKDP